MIIKHANICAATLAIHTLPISQGREEAWFEITGWTSCQEKIRSGAWTLLQSQPMGNHHEGLSQHLLDGPSCIIDVHAYVYWHNCCDPHVQKALNPLQKRYKPRSCILFITLHNIPLPWGSQARDWQHPTAHPWLQLLRKLWESLQGKSAE